MNKQNRFLSILILCCMALTASVAFASSKDSIDPPAVSIVKPSSDQEIVTQKRSLKLFHNIRVNGYINVIMTSKPNFTEPVITTRTKPSLPVNVRIENDTLYLNANRIPKDNKPPIVRIEMNQLHKLIVNGPANVSGQNVISRDLALESHGTGFVTLSGTLDVSTIKQTGNNLVLLWWVNSKKLEIHSTGYGVIEVAGAVDQLYAQTRSFATLQAKYLRAQDAWVQAKQHSSIYITPVKNLSAFAKQDANIYYYKNPKKINQEAIQSGNVLQMDWFN